MPDEATLTVTQSGEATVAKIAGELRLNIEAFEHQLDLVMLRHPKVVVLDLADLSFLSSLGMSLLVNLHRSVKRHGGQVRLAAVQPRVDAGLRYTHLTELMPSFPTVEAAIAG